MADKESTIEIESALGSRLSEGGWNYYCGHSQAFNKDSRFHKKKKKKTKDSRSRLAPTPNHYIFVWGPIYNNNLVYKSISKRFDILRICMNKLLRNIVYEELRLQRDVLDLKKHASKFLNHLIKRTLEYHSLTEHSIAWIFIFLFFYF